MDKDRIGFIEQHIKEREEIIARYRSSGIIDRDDAISKIMWLRLNDLKVGSVSCAYAAIYPIPLEEASDEQIVGELRFQIGILCGELAEMALKTGE